MGDTSNIVAIVALVISVISLMSTAAQVVQQYLASAEGYRRCGESVMGLWASGTQRRFRKSELRFEVVFETPVMFLARPDNERGPVPRRPIYSVTGFKESYSDTQTMDQETQKSHDEKAYTSVHTADDERASWVNLIAVLQRLEKDSRAWEQKNSLTARGIRYEKPKYTICVQIQKRLRSWDFMPPAMTRPFATTTICHLVEVTAILGMYWKAFDPDSWNLRAEGNGFILTSSLVQGLGLMVTFSATGMSVFERNRVIPCSEIKELCFGSVPSILEHDLRWGSPQEIVRTLGFVGCNADTIAKYHKRHTHLFSVTFEIIGMLAQTFRLSGSNFRMISNPTSETWTKPFSSVELMKEFQYQFALLTTSIPKPSHQMKALEQSWTTISCERWAVDEASIDIDTREVVHHALRDANGFLTIGVPRSTLISVLGAHLAIVLDELEDLKSELSSPEINTESKFMEVCFRKTRARVCGWPVDATKAFGTLARMESQLTDQSDDVKRQREDIWLTLMFRMCCWFVLHDFDEDDIFILPSRLKGSRLPVYIN